MFVIAKEDVRFQGIMLDDVREENLESFVEQWKMEINYLIDWSEVNGVEYSRDLFKFVIFGYKNVTRRTLPAYITSYEILCNAYLDAPLYTCHCVTKNPFEPLLLMRPLNLMYHRLVKVYKYLDNFIEENLIQLDEGLVPPEDYLEVLMYSCIFFCPDEMVEKFLERRPDLREEVKWWKTNLLCHNEHSPTALQPDLLSCYQRKVCKTYTIAIRRERDQIHGNQFRERLRKIKDPCSFINAARLHGDQEDSRRTRCGSEGCETVIKCTTAFIIVDNCQHLFCYNCYLSKVDDVVCVWRCRHCGKVSNAYTSNLHYLLGNMTEMYVYNNDYNDVIRRNLEDSATWAPLKPNLHRIILGERNPDSSSPSVATDSPPKTSSGNTTPPKTSSDSTTEGSPAKKAKSPTGASRNIPASTMRELTSAAESIVISVEKDSRQASVARRQISVGTSDRSAAVAGEASQGGLLEAQGSSGQRDDAPGSSTSGQRDISEGASTSVEGAAATAAGPSTSDQATRGPSASGLEGESVAGPSGTRKRGGATSKTGERQLSLKRKLKDRRRDRGT